MKGDFSRNTFDRQHRFSRVLMQQGRVINDADPNEQADIVQHYLRTLAMDLIGPHGGPGGGFEIQCTADECDFVIGRGHYYVDGILCENVPPIRCPESPSLPLTYTTQSDYPLTGDEELKRDGAYLVYLHVWEHLVTHLQAEHIREVALGGPDTATRARIVWQVKVVEEPKKTSDEATCAALLAKLVPQEGPRCLRARARVEEPSDDLCIIPPEARYRGAENQLYRVEIHRGGEAGVAKENATFKWSRDNGSVVFAIRSFDGSIATLDTLGPDDRRGLKEGDWVEFIHDPWALRGEPGLLMKVDAVDRVSFQVTLVVPEGPSLPPFDETTHPLLRRWDQGSDAVAVQEGKWIDLEDCVQVYFEPDGSYRTGDYWFIPSRTATGDVLWPIEEDEDGTSSPRALPPHGIEHHYAPLAHISVEAGVVSCDDENPCRCTFDPYCTAEGVQDEPVEDESVDKPGKVKEAARADDRSHLIGLKRIEEVGKTRAEALLASEAMTPSAVARMSIKRISALLRVNESVAKKIKESAAKIAKGGS